LKAELFDDAFDAAGADGQACLAEFLGDDVGGSLGVEEAVANDLADDFVGTAVVGFGAAFLAEQGLSALGLEEVSELEVALLGEAVLGGGLGGPEPLAIALHEHGQLAGDFVVFGDGEGAGVADEGMAIEVEGEHRSTWGPKEWGRQTSHRPVTILQERVNSQIKYGGKSGPKVRCEVYFEINWGDNGLWGRDVRHI
jgi:hypothetical protein